MAIKSIKITKSQRSSKIITIEIVIYCHYLIKKNKKKNKKEDKKSTFWNVKLKTNMIKLK
jgi:hypothetical protein